MLTNVAFNTCAIQDHFFLSKGSFICMKCVYIRFSFRCVPYTMYGVRCRMYGVRCTMYTVNGVRCTILMFFVWCGVRCTMYDPYICVRCLWCRYLFIHYGLIYVAFAASEPRPGDWHLILPRIWNVCSPQFCSINPCLFVCNVRCTCLFLFQVLLWWSLRTCLHRRSLDSCLGTFRWERIIGQQIDVADIIMILYGVWLILLWHYTGCGWYYYDTIRGVADIIMILYGVWLILLWYYTGCGWYYYDTIRGVADIIMTLYGVWLILLWYYTGCGWYYYDTIRGCGWYYYDTIRGVADIIMILYGVWLILLWHYTGCGWYYYDTIRGVADIIMILYGVWLILLWYYTGCGWYYYDTIRGVADIIMILYGVYVHDKWAAIQCVYSFIYSFIYKFSNEIETPMELKKLLLMWCFEGTKPKQTDNTNRWRGSNGSSENVEWPAATEGGGQCRGLHRRRCCYIR